MKQKFLNILLGATLVAGLFACGDDEKKVSSSVTFDGKKYPFDDASYYSYTDGNTFYNVTAYGTSGNEFIEVEFELMSEENGDLPVGNYTFSESSETLNDFDITLYDENFDAIDGLYEMKNGNVEVKKSGDTYTITFSFTFYDGENEVTIEGTYKGEVEELT